jgi:hypothetical protein
MEALQISKYYRAFSSIKTGKRLPLALQMLEDDDQGVFLTANTLNSIESRASDFKRRRDYRK